MQSKSLLVAIAAFAVTATGVQAYGGSKTFNRAGLNEDQVEAIEEARHLRATGDLTAARDKLAEAGIDETALQSIRRAADETRNVIHEALMAGDYEAFKEAVADSPLGDIITSESDFQQFQEARQQRLAGNWQVAEELIGGLDMDEEDWDDHRHGMSPRAPFGLSEEQREALRVARQANDRATMQAILDEAGVRHQSHR